MTARRRLRVGIDTGGTFTDVVAYDEESGQLTVTKTPATPDDPSIGFIDVYSSEGGIGHLPDLCVTVPVFHEGTVVAYVQAFGHHDDIGGAVPGSMPSHATSVFEEGLMVPPIKLRDASGPNRAVLTIMTRNSAGGCPADQETIRYTGVYGVDAAGEPYLMREVLGGGSGGRYYADGEDTIHVVPDSRNLPAEFSEARFPILVERLGLAVDSGGPGKFRGGLGYEKVIRMLTDGYFISIADRSILSCWGVNGGRAGRPFGVTIDPDGEGERCADALADAEFVPAGTLIRIRTTGGGGWGDPLDRDVELVVRDVAWGKVSWAGAAADYGVVITGSADAPAADIDETVNFRNRIRAERKRPEPFFDRGPGYARLAGVASAEVDWL